MMWSESSRSQEVLVESLSEKLKAAKSTQYCVPVSCHKEETPERQLQEAGAMLHQRVQEEPSHSHLYVEVVWNFLSHALYLIGFCSCV